MKRSVGVQLYKITNNLDDELEVAKNVVFEGQHVNTLLYNYINKSRFVTDTSRPEDYTNDNYLSTTSARTESSKQVSIELNKLFKNNQTVCFAFLEQPKQDINEKEALPRKVQTKVVPNKVQ